MTEETSPESPKSISQETGEFLAEVLSRTRKLLDSWEQSSGRGTYSTEAEPKDGVDPASFEAAFAGVGHSLMEIQEGLLGIWNVLLEQHNRMEELLKERVTLQSELARFSEQVMLLGQSCSDLSEEKKRLEKELEELRRKKEQVDESCGNLEAQVDKLTTENTRLQERITQSDVQRDRLEEELESLKKQLEDSRRTTEDLQNQLREKENTSVPAEDYQRLQQELEGIRAEKEVLEEQGKKQIERTLELEEELANIRRNHEELAGKNQDLDRSLREARHRWQDAEDRVHRLEVDLERLTREVEEVRTHGNFPEEAGPVMEQLQTEETYQLSQGDENEEESPIQDQPQEEMFETTDAGMFESDPSRIDSVVLSEEEALLEESGEETDETISSQEDLGEIFTDTEFETRMQEGIDSSLSEEPESSDSKAGEVPVDRPLVPQPKDSPEELRAAVDSIQPTGGGFQAEADDARRGSKPIDIDSVPSSEALYPDEEPTVILSRPPDSSGEVAGEGEGGRENESGRASSGEGISKIVEFPYPEITGEGLGNFRGRRVLLVGGDGRFREDYNHLFSLADAHLVYFPAISNLERKGMKRHVRESDIVIVFGAAVEEPGIKRLREITGNYGRYLLEHRSSGLVSLYHRLKAVNPDI